MYLDNPQEWVGMLFEEVLWPGHPLGRDTVGTEETVRVIGRDDCLAFQGSHYRGSATVVSVAGGVDPEHAQAAAQRALGGLNGAGAAADGGDIAAVPRPSEELRLVTKRTEQANICIGARSRSYLDPQRFAVDIMVTVLGEGMSSRLFQRVREELGLAYDVHAFSVRHRDTGAIGVYLGCEPRRADAALAVAVAELERLATESVPENELRKAQEYTAGRLRVQLEGTSSLCTFLGQQELLTGEILTPEQVIERIRAVTAEDVRKQAAEALENGLVGAVIGPFTKPDKFMKRMALS
jgi:predicted Zn-dependent peptidase